MEQTGGRGRLIAFEGIDGSGKSTQVRLLEERLRREGIPCCVTCEPTDAPAGALIRRVMAGELRSDPRAVAALFAADRMDHLTNPVDGLCGKLAEGISVLSDRYYFSSYAYQSIDMPMDWVIALNAPAAELLRPDATVFLDVDPEETVRRIQRNRSRQELYETVERLTLVREKYREAFTKLRGTETVLVIDAGGEPERVAEKIWENVRPFF